MKLTSNRPLLILAGMMLLVPAVGVPSELILQDTLKSALVALCVLLAALALVGSVRDRDATLSWHGLVWLPIALMAYALGSMAWSHAYLAGVEAVRWFVLGLLLWVGTNVVNRENVRVLAWAIHGGATAASVWAGLQFWFEMSVFPQAFGIAPGSTFVNLNFFAEFAVCALPFSLGLLVSMRPSNWTLGMAANVAFNIVALLMTGTRSALVALLVVTPLFTLACFRFQEQFACLTWNRSHQLLVAGVMGIAVLGLGSIPSHSTYSTADGSARSALERSILRARSVATEREYRKGTFSTRLQMWKSTARMVQDNPWFGVGAGAWEVEIPRYQPEETMLEMDYYTHNEALQILSEYGILGGLILAVLLAYVLQATANTLGLRGNARQEAPARLVALASLASLMTVSCAGFPLHLATTGALLSIGLALLAGSDMRLENQSTYFAGQLKWRHTHAKPVIFLLVFCSAAWGYCTVQAMRAEYKLIHAIHMMNGLLRGTPVDEATRTARTADMLNSIREGIAINPHYRKITAELAEPFAASGDWANAVWILESVVASRPHVAALWSALATGHATLGQHAHAQAALQHVKRLKPDAVATQTLEAFVLHTAGHSDQAIALLNHCFDAGEFDFAMLQTAYAIGYQATNWPLAIRSQELKIATWPEQAADGYFRLGLIYAKPAVHDDDRALASFKAGLEKVPPTQQANYLSQVPVEFRRRM